ncbi:hypothetical protein AQPW35_45700 [Rubrivivax pictus]|uniref:Uncharacterized protein n=1 Tax=Pseudaquabacterium pictum TaxID=2315236 RepID=A0A480AUX9_9BURK|nr:hypothetical protein AQPW35_45700 [Rubrivivax pictus]
MAFRPRVFFSGMPMTPNIIHTMKQTVNAIVLTISTDHAWRGMGVAVVAMERTRLGFDETVRLQGCREHQHAGYASRSRRTMRGGTHIVLKNYAGTVRSGS